MKRLQFVLLLSIPICWFFFKLLPAYTHPVDMSAINFIYADNLEQLKIWLFNAQSTTRFDDSPNFLYVFSLWLLMHFFKLTAIKAALTVSAISMMMSVYLMQRIVDSRFFGINLLLVGLMFMSTQVWGGVLGDEILFQGMLWLLAVRSFWKHRYTWLMIWTSINIFARPDSIFLLLPLIIFSYVDIKELKERDRKKFIFRRIQKTILFFVFPSLLFFSYRYWYFGKILPYNWLHISSTTDKHFMGFNIASIDYLKHYFRFYTLPLIAGIAFYFIKAGRGLQARYYAILFSLILIPIIYTCTFSQEENFAYKFYYPIYLGLILLSLLFIRDFRSITQGFTTAVFVFFFGFKTAFSYFQNTLQSDYNNEFYVASDLAQIHNGKAVVYNHTYLDWLTEWQVTYANGKHSKDGQVFSLEEVATSSPDIIIPKDTVGIKKISDKYDIFSVPKSSRTYEIEAKPDNSIDMFFYKYAHKVPVKKGDNYTVLVWKFGRNYNDIIKSLALHGAEIMK